MKRFFVSLGETSLDRVEEFQPGPGGHLATHADLLRWVQADIRRLDSYWGHDASGNPLPMQNIKQDLGLEDPSPDVHVLWSVGWDEEPAAWLCVEADSEELIRAAYPDLY